MIESDFAQFEDEEDELKHLANITAALKYYKEYSNARVYKNEIYLKSLDKRHQELLAEYRNHLYKIQQCIDDNYRVIQILVQDGDEVEKLFGNTVVRKGTGTYSPTISSQDMENIQSTLKQFVRDWSSDGEEERLQSYKPIIDEVEKFFDPNLVQLNEVKILVPGAGLGRLIFELASRGYFCEGNEFSYFMLIASNFVLNQCQEVNQYTLYPWIHQWVNNLSRKDQISPITFPDVCPLKTPPKGEMRMAAGDFLKVYIEENEWDCVATCFFIDCANNIVEFIETIYKILKPGGIWINLGPLLYHHCDVNSENSIQPTFEDLKIIIKAVGFIVLKSETGVRTKYAQNPRSMLKSEYESLFWVCRKPEIDGSLMGKFKSTNGNKNFSDIYNNDEIIH